MTWAETVDRYFGLLTLRELRAYVVRSHAVMMSAFLALVYALLAMTESGMLVLGRFGGGYSVFYYASNPLGQQPWNYPGLLVVAPWGVVELPWFGTFSMVVVSAGVGLGMAAAVLLAFVGLRRRRTETGGPATLGSLAGLTPAMIAALALGACCSTTAAATAGVGVIAQVSGSTTANLLYNNWYLGLFQIVVVWVALVAQEALLRAYGDLFGVPRAAGSGRPSRPARPDRRAVAGSLFRFALLVGGVTWSLAMFASWTDTDPTRASAAMWFDWIVLHQFVSVLAVAAALFPLGLADLLRRRLPSRLVRGAALVGGVLLLVGAPPPLSGWGVAGLGNELLAAAGAPSAWGGVPTAFGPLGALVFHWAAQYLLLGGFALAVALRPAWAVRPGLWSAGTPAPARSGSEFAPSASL